MVKNVTCTQKGLQCATRHESCYGGLQRRSLLRRSVTRKHFVTSTSISSTMWRRTTKSNSSRSKSQLFSTSAVRKARLRSSSLKFETADTKPSDGKKGSVAWAGVGFLTRYVTATQPGLSEANKAQSAKRASAAPA